MKLPDVSWFSSSDTQAEVLSNVNDFLRGLPDKLTSLYSPLNNSFFKHIEECDSTFQIIRYVFYPDMIDDRNAFLNLIRQENTREILYGTNKIKQLLNRNVVSAQPIKAQIKYLNCLWEELLIISNGRIDTYDKRQAQLLRILTGFLFVFLQQIKDAFSDATTRTLDFLEMSLMALDQLHDS